MKSETILTVFFVQDKTTGQIHFAGTKMQIAKETLLDFEEEARKEGETPLYSLIWQSIYAEELPDYLVF